MSTIRQTCPACQRMLELPASAIGRQAKCPACETQFAVPDSAAVQPESSAEASPTQSPFSTPVGGGIDDGASPYAAPSAGPSPTTNNPYQPSAATPMPAVTVGGLTIQKRSIDEIWETAFAIFKDRMGVLVGMYVAVFFVGLISAFAPQLLGLALDQAFGPMGNVVGNLGGSLVFNFLSIYLTLGYCKVALNAARNEPVSFSDLFPPLIVAARFVGGLILIGLAALLVFFVFGLIFAAIAAAGAAEVVTIGMLAGIFLVFLPGMIAFYWLMWSWAFILVDERGDWLSSIKCSYAITMQNKMTSVLLLLATMVLSFLGLLACYFGLLFTTPLWILMMAVGYLKITGQPISDPRSFLTNPAYPTPPASPSF